MQSFEEWFDAWDSQQKPKSRGIPAVRLANSAWRAGQEAAKSVIWVRLTKWTAMYTKVVHMDVEISSFAMWEPPSDGWMVSAISTTEKGLPPWEDAPTPDAKVVEDKPTLAEQVAAEVDPDPRNSRFVAPVAKGRKKK